MNDEITYKGVPIEVAKQIAEQYSKDQVIVVTWDSAFGMCHVVTYGKNKDDSLQAAKGKLCQEGAGLA